MKSSKVLLTVAFLSLASFAYAGAACCASQGDGKDAPKKEQSCKECKDGKKCEKCQKAPAEKAPEKK